MENQQPSEFRGAAGEAVRGFVSGHTLVTLVPVLVVMGILGLAAAAIIKAVGLSIPFIGLLMLVIASPIIGRFAMAARQGQLDAGFVSARLERGAVIGFVLRHATLCIAWGLPFTVAAHYLVARTFASPEGVLKLASGGMPPGAAGIGLMLLLVLATAAQLLSLLVATKADTVSQALSRDAWRWAVLERRADLVPLLAALVGGLIVFAMATWPVLGLLSLVAAKGSVKLAAAMAVFTYAAPALAAPVVLGRLCGAFVLGEASIVGHSPSLAPGPGPRPAPSRSSPVSPRLMGPPRPRWYRWRWPPPPRPRFTPPGGWTSSRRWTACA